MSLHELAGQVAVRLAVNGQELNLAQHKISSMITRNHVLYHVPTLHFNIDAMSDLVQTAGLYDGAEITASMAVSSQSSKFAARSYRVFRVKPHPGVQKYTYDVSCYYNKPEYFTNKVSTSHEGTARDCICQILGSHGIQFDIDGTSDHQIWRNTGMSPAQFIKRVVLPRMYGGDTSAYVYGYSSISDKVRVKDIGQILSKPEVVEFCNNFAGASNSTPVSYFHEYRSSMSSGHQNTRGGYGLTGYAFDLTQGSLTQNKGATVNVPSGDLNINVGLAGNTSRVIYDPLNVGNTHDNYNKARVQNTRILSTYSNHLELLCPLSTGCDMLDPVSVKMFPSGGTMQPDPTLSGKYIVAGVDMMATYNQYAERVHLVRNNIDVPNTGQLIA